MFVPKLERVMAESFIGQSFSYLRSNLLGEEILPLRKEGKETLLKNVDYYKKLSPTLQAIFDSEVVRFIKVKQFIDVRQNKQVSLKKKVLIASKSAQLTFGFQHVDFNFFNTIIIHPKEFYGKDNKLKRWEITTNGEIKISWKHFLKGLKLRNEDDFSLQLMANVLRIESEKNDWRDWLVIMQSYTLENRYDYHDIDYRELNPLFSKMDLLTQQNFFVACLIQFFNKPMVFKNRYPKLYRNVDLLLHSGFIRNAS